VVSFLDVAGRSLSQVPIYSKIPGVDVHNSAALGAFNSIVLNLNAFVNKLKPA
jgi:hypothetical protein